MTHFGHYVTLTWSNIDIDLSRSNYISLETYLREKHDDAIADSIFINSKVIRERIFRV